MSRRTADTASAAGQGMKRSTRMSLIAGVAVFLTLVSGVSFAAWTASSSKNSTATAGAVAVTTATAAGAATIAAFGPFTYTSTNQMVTKPITVRNAGTVDASVSSVTIIRSGTLAGNQIAVKFWAGTSAACAATTPVVSTTLSGGTVSLTTLNMTVASTASAYLCASTSFTGNMTTQAGKSTSATFAVSTSAGTNWNATDSVAAVSRTFAQDIFQTTVPNAPTNTQCVDQRNNYIVISWNTPTAFTTPHGGYNIYYNGSYIGNVSSTSTPVSGDALPGSTLTVRAVTSDGTESADSANISIEPSGWNRGSYYGISCG